MKKETEKKSKKWLWLLLGIVLLLAVVGVVLGFVLSPDDGAGDETVGGRPDLYWNVDKAFYTQDSETGMSSRTVAADGMYYICFAYNGEQVEYPVADKKLVNYIDSMDLMGLVIEDGVIVDAVLPTDIAVEVGYKVYVQSVTEDMITVNSSIALNGMKQEFPLCDLTQVYNVSGSAQTTGELIQPTDLQIMDTLYVYGNELGENTHVYLYNSPEQSSVYWRATQMYNSTDKITTRVPDESGAYSIEFYCDGELVTLKCKDVSLVTTIDSTSRYSPCFGFIFDEDGYIIEKIDSGLGIRAVQRSARYDVESVGDDGYVETLKIIGSNAGNTDAFYVTENTVIYDVSKAAVAENRAGKQVDSLQVGDRIVAWSDANGNAVLVYIANRVVEEATLCYGKDRKYDSVNKVTKREPDANGWYYVDVLMDGEVITVKTQDKALMSTLDSYSARVYGMTLKEGTNEIAYVYDSECVFGYTPFGQGRYVADVNGIVLSVFKAASPDTLINGVMTADCKIYNVSEVGTYGALTTFHAGDYVYLYRQPTGEIVFGYVIRTMVDTDVYYNLERKYDSTNKVTTREPDENGWYVYTMAVNGKQVQVKTQDKALATKIDSVSPGILALIVDSNGVVREAYNGAVVTGGYKRASGYTVKSINGDGTVTCVSSTGKEYILTLADDYKVYNVSQVYNSHRGEVGSIKVGDTITALTNTHEKTEIIFIRGREVDNMYINKEPMYDSDKSVSTRVPDANGWYWYELAVNGQLKKFRTNNVELANKIDYYGGGFGLVVDGDVIKAVTSPSYVKDVESSGVTNWDVTAINGNKITITYNVQGSKNTGKSQTITLASNAKIYDTSPTTNNYGAAAKLQVGDRIRTYVNADGEALYVYIRYHNTRSAGVMSHCDHCDKVVYWNPWMGGSFPSAGGHYYLVKDVETTKACSVGRSSTQVASGVVLDLNGHTYCRTNSRAMNIYTNASLSVFDTVGGGKITSVGLENAYGGVILMASGAKLNLYSGTLTPAEDQAHNPRGGVVYMTGSTSVFNMYGGTVTGGITGPCDEYPYSQGGNIFVNSGTFNMYGGTVSGGLCNDGKVEKVDSKGNPYTSTIRGYGGNIYSRGVDTAKVNIYGGTITDGSCYGGGNISGAGQWNITGGTVSNGKAAYRGGNFYISDGNWNISGGTISGGVSENRGGNIYITSPEAAPNEVPTPSVLTITGGTITGGTAKKNGGDNIAVVSESVFNMNGGTVSKGSNYLGTGVHAITGGKLDGQTQYVGGTLTVSGKPVITCLEVGSSKTVSLGSMASGASIAVDASGVFTGELTNAENYVKYFCAIQQGMTVTVIDNALALKKFDPNAFTAYCEHCDKEVQWAELAYLSGSGHYYLADDLAVSETFTISSGEDVILDLAGKTVTATDVRAFRVEGVLSIVDSATGGTIVGNGAYATGNVDGGVIYVTGSDAVWNLYSGTVKMAAEHNSIRRGGVVYVTGGSTANIIGGTIADGVSRERGGNITVVSNSSLNILGGEITGGSPYSLYVGSGTHTISGGNITGDVQYVDGSLTLSGAPIVSKLSVSDGKLVSLGELSDGAKICVAASGVFTDALANAQSCLTYFEAAAEGYEVTEVGGALAVTAAVVVDPDAYDAACPHCDGAVVNWTKWNGTAASGHFYLADDTQISGAEVRVTSGTDMVIDLSGKTVTATDVRAFRVEGVLSILDSATGGTIVGNGAYATGNVDGGVIYVTGSNAVWNLYSGTVEMAAEHNTIRRGGVAYVTGSSTANIIGGVIANGVSNERGGNITAVSSSHLNILGGEITGGSPENIYIGSGVHTVSGGTITGEVTYHSGAELTLSGAPVINYLNVEEGMTLNVGELTEGASITVSATGTFTTAGAEGYKDFFTTDLEGYEIGVVDGALAVVEAAAGGDGEDDTAKELCPCGCGTALDEVLWTEVTFDDTVVAPTYEISASGHYRVMNDIISGNNLFTFTSDASNVVIDMNGKTLAGTNRFAHYTTVSDGSLHIIDTVGTASYTVITEHTVGDSTKTNNAGLTGNWISIRNSTANIYGGTWNSTTTVEGNSTATPRMIYVRDGVLNVYGGTFDATGVKAGCGIMGSYGDKTATINIYDGTFIEGEGNDLGNAWRINAKSTLNISGGNIQGQVYAEAGAAVNVSGDAVITNLDLTAGVKVIPGGLTEGASITVTAAKDTEITDALTDAEACKAYFDAVGTNMGVIVKDGKLVVTEICPCGCGTALDEVLWTEVTFDDTVVAPTYEISASGHYRVMNDITSGNNLFTFTSDASNVVIDMNGKTLAGTNRFAHYTTVSDGSLHIIDTVGTASYTVITEHTVGDSTKTNNAGLTGNWISIRNSTANIYGGTWNSTTTVEGNSTATPRMIYVRDGVLNVYGGTFDATGVKAGCGIMGSYGDKTATINIYDGTFVEGEGNDLGNAWRINAKSTLNISGGTIQGQVYAESGATVNLSGAPVITNLDLTSGAKVTLGELTKGASVKVTAADGAFTAANEKAADYATYFSAVAEGKTVQVNADDQLVIADEAAEGQSLLAAVVRSVANFFGLCI